MNPENKELKHIWQTVKEVTKLEVFKPTKLPDSLIFADLQYHKVVKKKIM